jgi:uncharacterized protein (TIGR01370 family)
MMAPPQQIQHWAVYYGKDVPGDRFRTLDLVVFDRRYHPSLNPLKYHTHVLAYVSIGEVYDDVPEKLALAEDRALLTQQAHWKSHVVDATSPRWHKLVLGYVSDALAHGFDGVMLDTVDSPIDWAAANAPTRVDAMRMGITGIIAEIRAAHPQIKIMVNRGLDIMPAVASKIDYVMAESILTNVNVSTGQFSVFSPTTYTKMVTDLHQVSTTNPHVQILTLDYWNEDDRAELQKIYATQRGSGFAPYVTAPDLLHYTPEPAPAARPIDDKER